MTDGDDGAGDAHELQLLQKLREARWARGRALGTRSGEEVQAGRRLGTHE